MLTNIPSVEVDIDGGISLRGSGSVTILIDGRPSSLTGSDRAAILEQIPASSIERVEVITNPSARYDPDGVSGIINIVLKKNKFTGFNGNTSVSAGTNDKYNASLGLNYRNSRYNVFGNYNYRYNNRLTESENYRKNTFSEDVTYLDQFGDGNRLNRSHLVKLGGDLYINPKNTFSASATLNLGEGSSREQNKYIESDAFEIPYLLYNRDNHKSNYRNSVDYNLYYMKEFNKKGTELVFDATLSKSESESNTVADERYYNPDLSGYDSLPWLQNTSQFTNYAVNTYSVDFFHNIGKKGKIETGYKWIDRNNDNDFFSESFDSTSNDYEPDVNLNNRFIYDEQIHGVYGTYGTELGKFGVMAGLRLEQAYTESYLVNTDETFENNYFSYFPTLHISYELPKGQEVLLSYSRRINRPNTRSLNPFTDFSDPKNIRTGNPFLKPEYVNSVEAGYALQWGKNSISGTAYYRYVDDIKARIRTVDTTGVSYLTWENLNHQQTIGLEAIGVFQLTKWWNLNASWNYYFKSIDGSNVGEANSNDGSSWTLKGQMTFNAWKGGQIQTAGNYRAPNIHSQGDMAAMYSFDIAIRQKMLKGKGTLNVKLSDVFDTRRFSFNSVGEGYEQEGIYNWETRILNATFSYNFGKMTVGKRKKKGKNTGSTRGSDEMM